MYLHVVKTVNVIFVYCSKNSKHHVRPDIFYVSSFKNPDRILSRNGKKLYFCIADRMKIVPNLKKIINTILFFTMQRTLSVRKKP